MAHPSISNDRSAPRVGDVVQMLGGRETCHIFVHDVRPQIRSQLQAAFIPGVRDYDQRALVVARPWDVVCVRAEVDQEYLAFLDDCGLGPRPENILALDSPEDAGDLPVADRLAASPALRRLLAARLPRDTELTLNPFLADPGAERLAQELSKDLGRPIAVECGDPAVVADFHRKLRSRALADECSVPTPPGEVVHLPPRTGDGPIRSALLRDAVARRRVSAARAVIRGDFGFGGSSIFIADGNARDTEHLLTHIAAREDNDSYIVEEMVNATSSPNLVYHIGAETGEISLLGAADQLLGDRLVHVGNVSPSTATTLPEMQRYAERMCHRMADAGCRGVVGFDFIEHPDPSSGELTATLVEVNPRVNASLYPQAILDHLNAARSRAGTPAIAAYAAGHLSVSPCAFAELRDRCGRRLFRPDRGAGILPFSTGGLAQGRLDVAFLGSTRDDVLEMFREFVARFGSESNAQITSPAG